METTLLNKLPKKWHRFIKDVYKEYGRYSAVIVFEDGFSRSIGEYTFKDFKDYIKMVIEEDRNAEM